ncbi:MAG: hypothetical protein IKP65_06585, partial [Alphaproteobacteria bacterium]|nr:hypothetical protein [Alphaproteobacteria bacterium]
LKMFGEFCLEFYKFISKKNYNYKGLVIEISKYFTMFYNENGIYYYSPVIINEDGLGFAVIGGGFETEKEALKKAKEYIEYKHN